VVEVAVVVLEMEPPPQAARPARVRRAIRMWAAAVKGASSRLGALI
jgi:hypothetical protein